MENTKVGFKARLTKYFAKLKGRFLAFFNKEYLAYSAHKYGAFTALQVKEVFGKEKESKSKTFDKILAIVVPVVKFGVVFAVSYVLFE